MTPLAQRVLTASVLLIGILAVLFAAPMPVAVGVAASVTLLGAWEWSAFLGWKRAAARTTYTVFIALLLAIGEWLVPNVVPLPAVLWVALAWWGLALLWIVRYPTPVPVVLAALAGVLVLVPFWLAMVSILRIPNQGPALTLLALCVVSAADIGAYFSGHRFGRLKLAPQVSPGKTWEGLIGGVLLAGLAAAVGAVLLDLPAMVMLPTGLGVAVLSVVGDLTESMFKRNVGAKDSGHLVPGHGGVLDRLDSITAAMPLFALALSWLGLIAG